MGDYLTERFLRLPDGSLPHMGVKGGGDVAPYVLLSGDPGRVEKMKTWLDTAEGSAGNGAMSLTPVHIEARR